MYREIGGTLRKKLPTKKGSWSLTGPKSFKNQSGSHFCTGVSHANCTLWRSQHYTTCLCTDCLPALCPYHLSQPLKSSFWNPILTNRTEVSPIQSELHSYILINIFTGQSRQLHSEQSAKCLLDQPICKDLESSFV